MARIKDTSVEAVKQAADIVALVEARTRLRKVGGRYTGLCPFHQEKTPSFSVSPDRGTYHCFGCGVGGDSISFVEEIEGVDFVGAIEWLADRFSVPLEYEDSSPAADAARKRRDRLHALLEQAAAFYERVSLGQRGGRAGARVPRRARAGRGDLQGVSPRSLAGRELARAQGAREGIHAGGAVRGRARRAVAAATTSRTGSCSRSPMRAGASSASRRASCARTIRCAAST